MNKEQEAKFEENREGIDLRIRHIHNDGFPCDRWSFEQGYKYALEANGIGEDPRIPEGYFKPGERVECRTDVSDWEDGIIIARARTVITEVPSHVRRIPAWKPKDGEAVLFRMRHDISGPGVASSDTEVWDFTVERWPVKMKCEMKPFDASKIGKPWSEI